MHRHKYTFDTMPPLPPWEGLIMHLRAVGGYEIGFGVSRGTVKEAIHICQQNQQVCLQLNG